MERTCQEFQEAREDLSDEELYARLTDEFGEPHLVALQYQDEAEPLWNRRQGYAPGWRICCTTCGRSAPASAAGIIRIGARSYHKYVLGWCRGCGWFRRLRLQRDLKSANITKTMGLNVTSAQYRDSIHMPVWLLVLLVTVLGAIPLLIIRFVLPS
ncbi:hypothetical protein C5Y97_03615 [Blastopirellula marina]|uniref:Uncharacterized protein n=1 Tax=Blastopirellula marina TaxID=124 RepID=A0A2S8G9W7_9BACT|nr:hypothetical protein C5Y98_03615 [Blastopirellula marina]PTL45937.1 hypothetical protein C5Y97_03615 [Blastopirellula marina]